MMAITDVTWSDGGALEDLRHCGNMSNTYRGSTTSLGNSLQLIQSNIQLTSTHNYLSSEFLKPKPFTVNVADVLQRECIESCLDIPITEKVNPVGISILNVSEHIIY